MFFQKLLTLLATCQSLNIVMEQKDDIIILSVQLKYKEDKDDKDKLPPIVLSGTAKELDEGFAEAFGKIEKNLGIFTNIDMFLQQVKELEKEAKGKVVKATKTVDKAEGGKTPNTVTTETSKNVKSDKDKVTTKEPPKVTLSTNLFDAPSVEPTKQPVEESKTEPVKETIPGPIHPAEETKAEPKPNPVTTIPPVVKTEPSAATNTATAEDDIF